MSLFLDVIIIGILSCLMMDLWQKLLKLTYNINPSDWKIIGRWFIFVVLKNKIYNPNIENETVFDKCSNVKTCQGVVCYFE